MGPNVGAPRQRSPSIAPLAQAPRRRSPPSDPHLGSGQIQEEVIERQQQRTRVPAPQATPHWTLDEETWLTELLEEGLHIEYAAEQLGRTIEDVILRWSHIEARNSEIERRVRERQRARENFQIHHRPTNPAVTNQAPPAAHAEELDIPRERTTQRFADMEVDNREAERRCRERHRGRDKSWSRHRPANSPLANQAPPAAHADVLDSTPERRRTQRIADMEAQNREDERRGRERHGASDTSRSRHQPANPLLANQAPQAAHADVLNRSLERRRTQRITDMEADNRENERRVRERHGARDKSPSRHGPANSPLANQAPPASPPEVLDRTLESMLQRIADMRVDNREAERRGREQQRARDQSQSRYRPANPPLANQASPALPATNLHGTAENVTQRLADTDAENREVERGGGERQETGEELNTALLERQRLSNVRLRLAEIEDEDWEAERRARERQRIRGELWADIEDQNRKAERRRVELQRARELMFAIIEDERRDSEWRARERHRAREELQNRCLPTNPAVTNRAAQTAPAVIPPVRVAENEAQGPAIVEDVAPGTANIPDVAHGSANTPGVAQGSANIGDERIEEIFRILTGQQIG